MNPSPAILTSNVPGNGQDFFSLGWEELQFKACATLSVLELNSRILVLLRAGFPFLYFAAPWGLSVLLEGGRGKYPFLNCALW